MKKSSKDYLEGYHYGRKVMIMEVMEILDAIKKHWKVCSKDKCENKKECDRANHYIKTIWNPAFKEAKNEIIKLDENNP